MTSEQGGFINSRTGEYVSPERAAQHVGPENAFGGYEKAQSKTTGNFYMRETGTSAASALDDFIAGRITLGEYQDRKLENFCKTRRAGVLGHDGRSA